MAPSQAAVTTPSSRTFDPALRVQIQDPGTRLPALWRSGRLDPEQQKELLLSLIRRVVLARPAPETVEVSIVWVSGAVTRRPVQAPVGCRMSPRLAGCTT